MAHPAKNRATATGGLPRMDTVTLRGELGNILEWTGSGAENEKTDTPLSGMSVSVVAGAGSEPATFRL